MRAGSNGSHEGNPGQWDVKIFQHGTPAEAKCLAQGYEPFANLGINMTVQNRLANTQTNQTVMVLAFKKFFWAGVNIWEYVEDDQTN